MGLFGIQEMGSDGQCLSGLFVANVVISMVDA